MAQVADRRFEVIERPAPAMGAEQGLLRVQACGLCGSDVEQYKGSFVAKGLVRYPLIPGHEPVGVIEDIGAQASRTWGVKTGDRVAVEPHIACGSCPTCLGGRYHLCRSLLPIAPPAYGYLPLDFEHGLWGAYADYLPLHRRTIVHKLPPDLPLELATMYQFVAAGIRWAVHVPQTAFGDAVLVLGCGQRGLGAVLALAEAGVRTIIVTGLARDQHKLALARALGAHHTILADEENTVERVMALTQGRGVDVALDVTPAATQPVRDALQAVRTGGTVVLAGIKGGTKSVDIDTDALIYRELRVQGVFTQAAAAYDQAIDLIARRRDRLAALHTHTFPLESAAAAIETLAGERAGEEAICITLDPAASP